MLSYPKHVYLIKLTNKRDNYCNGSKLDMIYKTVMYKNERTESVRNNRVISLSVFLNNKEGIFGLKGIVVACWS